MALYCFDSWFLKKTLFAVCEMTKPSGKKKKKKFHAGQALVDIYL